MGASICHRHVGANVSRPYLFAPTITIITLTHTQESRHSVHKVATLTQKHFGMKETLFITSQSYASCSSSARNSRISAG